MADETPAEPAPKPRRRRRRPARDTAAPEAPARAASNEEGATEAVPLLPSPEAAEPVALLPPPEADRTVVWRFPRIDLSALAILSNDVRTLMVNLTVLLTIVVIVPVIGGQFVRDQVLIEPLSVPEALLADGLTAEVAANRLWDGLKEVKDEANTAKSSVSAIPDSRQVSFSIPDSGLSIDSLIYYVRRFFNVYETRISGELRCGDPGCAPEHVSMRLRVMAEDLDLLQLPERGERTEAQYFREAASAVMGVLDPFTAIAADAEADPRKATVLARRLIRGGHPDAKWAHNLIGNMRIDADDLPGAIEEYRAALALDPGFAQSLANLGNTLRLTGDLAGARKAFETIEEKDPQDRFAAMGFARLAIDEKQPDEAIRWLIEANRRDPLNPEHLTRAGMVEDERGNAEAAMAYWRQALEIDPGAPAPLAYMGAQYLVAEHYAEAERLYRDAADYTPDDASLQGQHADLLILIGKNDEALLRVNRAIALDPKKIDYRITRAKALSALGRLDDALATLAEAEPLDPDNARLHYDRGMVLSSLGRNEEAIAAMRRNLELDPDSPTRFLTDMWIETWSRLPADPVPAAVVAQPG